jgi:hypothetical protein
VDGAELLAEALLPAEMLGGLLPAESLASDEPQAVAAPRTATSARAPAAGRRS